MARTEKKFGQVNVAPAATYSTLVPSSANRRNVLINVTAEADDTLHLVTSSGAISASVTGSSATIVANTLAISPATNNRPIIVHRAYNDNGTRAIHSTTTTSGSGTFFLTVSGTTSGHTVTELGAIGVGTNSAGPNLMMGLYRGSAVSRAAVSPAANRVYTKPVKFAANQDKFMFITADIPSTLNSQTGYDGKLFGVGTHSTLTLACQTTTVAPSATISGTTYSPSTSYHSRTLQVLNRNFVVGVQNSSTGSTISNNSAILLYSYPDSATLTSDTTVQARPVVTLGTMPTTTFIANYMLVDQNPVFGEFAVLNGTIALTDPALYPQTNGSGNGTAVGISSAGFRIVDNSKASQDGGLAYLTGGYTYPAAPTGVTVPSAEIPTVSVRFSPNGKYLAVAYDRDYSSTGDTNSVVVIYTRQSNGTYLHTYSSGNKIEFRPEHFDSMVWTPDSAGIVVRGSDTKIYTWYPGVTGSGTSYLSVTHSGAYPNTPAFGAPITGNSSTAAIAVGSSSNAGITFFTSQTGKVHGLVYPIYGPASGGGTESQNSASTFHGTHFNITAQGTSSATNYVNTVTNGLPITANTVTQITGIVLEANERLEVDATTGGRLNVNAYGVEIS
jgi:hypothetical protein